MEVKTAGGPLATSISLSISSILLSCNVKEVAAKLSWPSACAGSGISIELFFLGRARNRIGLHRDGRRLHQTSGSSILVNNLYSYSHEAQILMVCVLRPKKTEKVNLKA